MDLSGARFSSAATVHFTNQSELCTTQVAASFSGSVRRFIAKTNHFDTAPLAAECNFKKLFFYVFNAT